jgi:hypothetical protein
VPSVNFVQVTSVNFNLYNIRLLHYNSDHLWKLLGTGHQFDDVMMKTSGSQQLLHQVLLGVVHSIRTQRRGGGLIRSVCMRIGGGRSTRMYVRTEGDRGVRAGYILNNVSNLCFLLASYKND